MPVLQKIELTSIQRELHTRFTALLDAIEARELRSDSEGCKRGHWVTPDAQTATRGTSMEIRMAADDFKNILTEVRRIK